jgi:hypothetical protein
METLYELIEDVKKNYRKNDPKLEELTKIRIDYFMEKNPLAKEVYEGKTSCVELVEQIKPKFQEFMQFLFKRKDEDIDNYSKELVESMNEVGMKKSNPRNYTIAGCNADIGGSRFASFLVTSVIGGFSTFYAYKEFGTTESVITGAGALTLGVIINLLTAVGRKKFKKYYLKDLGEAAEQIDKYLKELGDKYY